MPTVYPIVSGHKIVGRVTNVGPAGTKYKVGDFGAVGCLVDSYRTCPHCEAGLENFCPNQRLTFNAADKYLGGVTYGGYSDSIVVDERFVLRVPSNLALAGAAPLPCAGITTYSPMRRWGVTKGKNVGVFGLGGLGHINGAFLDADLIDEVSLLVAPGIDGRRDIPAVFDGLTYGKKAATPLKLKSVEQRANDVLWIRYEVIRT